MDERRGEAFVTSTWNLRTAWNLELTARAEYSELAQRGETTQTRSFFFPKPRAQLTWSRQQDQVRFLVERTMGQLDFTDFASSASLADLDFGLRREVYGGIHRTAVPSHIDTRRLGIGPYFGILVRRRFGMSP